MYNSSGQYKINYGFDLVIFKPVTRNTINGPRRFQSLNYSNIQSHNINAAIASGFDLNSLNQKNAFNNQNFHLNHNHNNNNTIHRETDEIGNGSISNGPKYQQSNKVI